MDQQDVAASADVVDAHRRGDQNSLGDEELKKRDAGILFMSDDSKAVGVLREIPLAEYVSSVASSIKVNVEIVREITRDAVSLSIGGRCVGKERHV